MCFLCESIEFKLSILIHQFKSESFPKMQRKQKKFWLRITPSSSANCREYEILLYFEMKITIIKFTEGTRTYNWVNIKQRIKKWNEYSCFNLILIILSFHVDLYIFGGIMITLFVFKQIKWKDKVVQILILCAHTLPI